MAQLIRRNSPIKIILFLVAIFSTYALAETKVTLDLNNLGETIHRNIYGQFTEHLGRGIYEGIWVGPDSTIPNTRGFRNDVIAALKDINVPLLRWPGGCFADEYHWRNGIGPREQRPKTVNTNWGGVTDDNAFGTHEFFELAEMLDAEVYINGNLGTGTPREMAEWLEYMTSDSGSTIANLRRKNGREKPWKVDYFAIGNESWGCGGTMTPEYYANLYRHYVTFLKTPKDNQPVMIASGGYNELTNWTEGLLENIPKTWSIRMQAIGHHYYTIATGDWANKGKAIGFPKEEWLSALVNTIKIEDYIQKNIEILDKHDPENTIGFYVDEWGTWYEVEEGDNPGFLFQQNTIRDAIIASLNLNIFHKYSHRVQMTNIAQMVNVLQAMILTDKEKMLLTPTYYIFKMYKEFQDATFIPLEMENNPMYGFNGMAMPQLSASAAKTAKGKVILALTNAHHSHEIQVTLEGQWRKASGELLSAKSIDSHNTFNNKLNVQPKPFQAKRSGKSMKITVPAKSVIVVKLN